MAGTGGLINDGEEGSDISEMFDVEVVTAKGG
jgi:hypothetical protein